MKWNFIELFIVDSNGPQSISNQSLIAQLNAFIWTLQTNHSLNYCSNFMLGDIALNIKNYF